MWTIMRLATALAVLGLTEKSSANDLSIAGRCVVFRTGRTIRFLDASSGAASVLMLAGGRVVGLSIERSGIAWAVHRPGKDRIRPIVLPSR